MDLLFAKAPGDVDYHSESRGDLFVSREPDKAAKIEFHLSSLGIRGKSTGELFSDESRLILGKSRYAANGYFSECHCRGLWEHV